MYHLIYNYDGSYSLFFVKRLSQIVEKSKYFFTISDYYAI
ncbi:MAG: hypothetical protein RHS_2075 [Robinsoniella sp. RHS]|nr:MAG: hypothetical protein RHS_2075 [Robinsoniella sp. RHS]